MRAPLSTMMSGMKRPTTTGIGAATLAKLRFVVVSALTAACVVVDEFAYRPALVRATIWMPRYWRCDLARLSIFLDDRWKTGFWEHRIVPGELCDVCHRRPSLFEVGGPCPDVDDEAATDPDASGSDERDYMEDHPISLCGWCKPDFDLVDDGPTLRRAVAAGSRRSISWRWRYWTWPGLE